MDVTISTDEWAELYVRSCGRVYRALLATLRNPTRAEDALHDAFMAGLRHPPPRRDNLEGWLYRVALRAARRSAWQLVRARMRHDQPDRDEIGFALDRLEATRLLALLTERQRAILIAHYYLGFTHAETAELFGLRPGTVSATIAQSLVRLRKGDARV